VVTERGKGMTENKEIKEKEREELTNIFISE